MPEGPEVKIRAERLQALLRGKCFTDIETLGAYSTEPKYQTLRKKIAQLRKILTKDEVQFDWVRSRGKQIYIQLGMEQDGKHKVKYLTSHLGMTGDWKTAPDKFTCLRIEFSGEHNLYFDDVRRLGEFDILTVEEMKALLNRLGPDVLSKSFTERVFLQRLEKYRQSKRAIATILADQAIISGIGNYLRCDILYTAEIDPRTPVKDLFTEENKTVLDRLYRAIVETAKDSYAQGSTVLQMYRDYNRATDISPPGHYEPKVYGREMDPEGREVETMTIQGRTLYWVPQVQKLL
jgi:DNA-formamidopyrimidine glycosylase